MARRPIAPSASLLSPRMLRAGVRKREVWAWAMYDFANSGYTTVVLTTVFSAYFVGVVAQGQPWATLAFTAALSLSYLLVMLTMPWLGARADATAGKRRLLFSSTLVCVAATAMLYVAGPNTLLLALVFLAVSNYAYGVGESTIAAFLPELAEQEALGRVSGWGWGFGYFGGMLTLGLSLWLVSSATAMGQQATDYVPLVMLLTAAVFAVAALPAFWLLKERSAATHRSNLSLPKRLMRSWHDVSLNFPDLRRLLFCGACYHAGITVVVTLSAVYANQAMGFSMQQTMLLIFTVNIAAAVGALLFGYVQDAIGHKRALTFTLWGWVLMVVLAVAAVEVWVFWLAATVAGFCMGTSQSAGRAMVGALTPSDRLAEFYSLWAFATQLAAVVGPLFYGSITWATGGNHRVALLCTGIFFLAALAVLRSLNFARGAAVRDTVYYKATTKE